MGKPAGKPSGRDARIARRELKALDRHSRQCGDRGCQEKGAARHTALRIFLGKGPRG